MSERRFDGRSACLPASYDDTVGGSPSKPYRVTGPPDGRALRWSIPTDSPFRTWPFAIETDAELLLWTNVVAGIIGLAIAAIVASAGRGVDARVPGTTE